eukprot:1160183-Pelagomonas_calceolata.AAC.4
MVTWPDAAIKGISKRFPIHAANSMGNWGSTMLAIPAFLFMMFKLNSHLEPRTPFLHAEFNSIRLSNSMHNPKLHCHFGWCSALCTQPGALICNTSVLTILAPCCSADLDSKVKNKLQRAAAAAEGVEAKQSTLGRSLRRRIDYVVSAAEVPVPEVVSHELLPCMDMCVKGSTGQMLAASNKSRVIPEEALTMILPFWPAKCHANNLREDWD